MAMIVKKIDCLNKIGCLMIIIWFLYTGQSFARECMVEADGYYIMGDGLAENQSIAKERARSEAVRRAGEQAAVYVKSSSEVKNGQITKDEISLFSSTVLQVIKEEYTPVVVGESIKFQCHIVAKIDTDSIREEMQKDLMNIKTSLLYYEKENDRLKKEMEDLKKQSIKADNTQKSIINEKIKINNIYFKANEYFNKGFSLDLKGDYWGAIAAYSNSIELNGNNAIAYNNIGTAYSELGQYEKSIECYEKAIGLNPALAEAYNNMGAAYGELGQDSKAIEFYNKAIECEPKYADAYYNMGNEYSDNGHMLQAIESYKMAISINPHHAESYNNIGIIFAKLNRDNEALKYLRKAIELRPSWGDAYDNLGVVYRGLGEFQKSLEYHDKAIQLKPDLANAYYNKAVVYKKIGKLQDALDYYIKAVNLDHNFYEA